MDYAVEHRYSQVKGEYIATSKNEMVQHLFKNLGFSEMGGYWIMDTQYYSRRKTFIQMKIKQ
jgi:predicted enzyme involved in methoxymalonyl-ACP biosynthesis